MHAPDLPLISTNIGATGYDDELRAAITTLRRAIGLRKADIAAPVSLKNCASIAHGASIEITKTDEIIIAEVTVARHATVRLSFPCFLPSDARDLDLTILFIGINSLGAYLRGPDHDLETKAIDRNDAICVAIAMAHHTCPHKIQLRPATPFTDLTAVVRAGKLITEWSMPVENRHWLAALHINFFVSTTGLNGNDITFEGRTSHDGPTIDSPLEIMRSLGSLPAAPTIIVDPTAWDLAF